MSLSQTGDEGLCAAVREHLIIMSKCQVSLSKVVDLIPREKQIFQSIHADIATTAGDDIKLITLVQGLNFYGKHRAIIGVRQDSDFCSTLQYHMLEQSVK